MQGQFPKAILNGELTSGTRRVDRQLWLFQIVCRRYTVCEHRHRQIQSDDRYAKHRGEDRRTPFDSGEHELTHTTSARIWPRTRKFDTSDLDQDNQDRMQLLEEQNGQSWRDLWTRRNRGKLFSRPEILSAVSATNYQSSFGLISNKERSLGNDKCDYSDVAQPMTNETTQT